MRGKDASEKTTAVRSGITPAYAGKREGAKCAKINHKDHPRLCGEKRIFLRYCQLLQGSPPPMRGKAHKSSGTAFSIRITPAYAGKSDPKVLGVRNAKDPPRLCGEKSSKHALMLKAQGSPPPMRGKATLRCQLPEDARITPAYAGKSRSFSRNLIQFQDHPRLCGEK